MTIEEFENFLKSIDGLENGYFTDRDSIKSAGFFSIGEGWLQLVKTLIEECIKLGWDKQICQVKEKFGGLRFYINSASEEIHTLISKYENLSYYICEQCGTSENVGITQGWLTTICESCKTEHYSERKWSQLQNKSDKLDEAEFKKVFNGNS
ncbi:MAG: hypothetical protein ACC656_08520 [Candidatus Heimdallarchaeota archaeon]